MPHMLFEAVDLQSLDLLQIKKIEGVICRSGQLCLSHTSSKVTCLQHALMSNSPESICLVVDWQVQNWSDIQVSRVSLTKLREGCECNCLVRFSKSGIHLLKHVHSVWMRGQVDKHLVNLLLVFCDHLGYIFRALRISKISGKVTDHIWEVVSIRAIVVGPSFLIFPGSNMVGHL